ncbi:MAG: hypothetical protein GDA44_02240 [Prochloron sp. SP5CPC1]|nr:hypothetical protein [Candidatus Paraprochloron terpiosi SP5CPC1]
MLHKIRWHRFRSYFDQILFLVACTSLVAAIFLFLHQDKLKSQFDGTTADNQTEAANAQFIAYMLRSLKEIEGQELAREENATTVNPLSPVNSPTPEPIPVQTPQVITRTTYIPIPVYPQTPTETVTPTETETETPTTTETVIPTETITPTPSPTETETPSPTETETPTETITPTPSLESEPTPPLSPEPNHNHTLVGLLELGDRSVALFDINGNIERIHLGEEIGASGWILDSVADREVKIRGYDTQRSIYVGQKF